MYKQCSGVAAKWTPRKEEGKNKVFRKVQLGLCGDALPGAEGSSAAECALCPCAFLCSPAEQWAQRGDTGQG